MAIRPGSFRTRTAATNALVVAAILVANSVYLLLAERAEVERTREALEEHTVGFARLTQLAIGRAFEHTEKGDESQFRELVQSYFSLEPAIARLQVLSPAGEVLFNHSRAVAPPEGAPAADWAAGSQIDALRLQAVRSRALTRIPRPSGVPGVDDLEVLLPYHSRSGEHAFSLSYLISFSSLAPAMYRRFQATLWLTLVSVLAALLVAAVLASRITRPIQELTQGALEIGEGNFERRLNVGGDDEIRILADTFNQMAARLKENVLKLEESNKVLAGLNEELKELDRLKSDLLANVSHELRTPLTAIKGYTDYLLEGELGPINERQAKGLTVVHRNLERLSRTINALLDFSTIDVGRMTLDKRAFALLPLVQQIQQTLRSELERKQLRFELDIPPQLPPVEADREKLAQVLENLVVNAIKFTPAGGGIRVAAARRESPAGPELELCVTDEGIGIPQDQIGKIFNRFHQVDGSSTRRFGGVGLGLAIVRGILEAHGAEIAVESREGRGSSFRFRLPLAEQTRTLPPVHPGYP